MSEPRTTPEYEQMVFDHEVAGSAFAQVEETCGDLMKNAKFKTSNLDFIQASRDRLIESRDLIADAIQKVAVARGSAHVAAYHGPSVAAQKDDIVAKVKEIASWEKQLLKLDTAVDKAADEQNDGLYRQMDEDDAYEETSRRFIELAGEMKDLEAGLRPALETTHENAKKHLARGDASGLEMDKTDADGLALKKLEDGVRELAKLKEKAEALQHAAGNEARMSNMQGFGRARGTAEALGKSVPALLEMKKAIKAMKVAPVDVAKAMKTLGVPATHKGALAKALEGDDARRTKALDDLSKKAGLDKSGKEMLAALKAAKVV